MGSNAIIAIVVGAIVVFSLWPVLMRQAREAGATRRGALESERAHQITASAKASRRPSALYA